MIEWLKTAIAVVVSGNTALNVVIHAVLNGQL